MNVPKMQLTVSHFIIILGIYTKFCFIDVPQLIYPIPYSWTKSCFQFLIIISATVKNTAKNTALEFIIFF